MGMLGSFWDEKARHKGKRKILKEHPKIRAAIVVVKRESKKKYAKKLRGAARKSIRKVARRFLV